MPKLLFRLSLRAANSLATSIRQSLSVLRLWVLSIVRLPGLLNLVCVIAERSHVFSLRVEENDLSPAALVAEFTRKSLHMVMISLIIHFSASENCLILAKMSRPSSPKAPPAPPSARSLLLQTLQMLQQLQQLH